MSHRNPGHRIPLLAVVDDDESVRESIPALLCAVQFAACAFSSAEAFLASDVLDEVDCLILDVVMPGMSGVALRDELKARAIPVPIVFITANADKALCERLRAGGAIACLRKPFSAEALLRALELALQQPSP